MRLLRLIAEAFAAEIRRQTLEREREIIEARVRAEFFRDAVDSLNRVATRPRPVLAFFDPSTAPTAQKLN